MKRSLLWIDPEAAGAAYPCVILRSPGPVNTKTRSRRVGDSFARRSPGRQRPRRFARAQDRDSLTITWSIPSARRLGVSTWRGRTRSRDRTPRCRRSGPFRARRDREPARAAGSEVRRLTASSSGNTLTRGVATQTPRERAVRARVGLIGGQRPVERADARVAADHDPRLTQGENEIVLAHREVDRGRPQRVGDQEVDRRGGPDWPRSARSRPAACPRSARGNR